MKMFRCCSWFYPSFIFAVHSNTPVVYNKNDNNNNNIAACSNHRAKHNRAKIKSYGAAFNYSVKTRNLQPYFWRARFHIFPASGSMGLHGLPEWRTKQKKKETNG